VSTAAEFEKAIFLLARFRSPVGRNQGREQTLDAIQCYALAQTCKILWQQPVGLEMGE